MAMISVVAAAIMIALVMIELGRVCALEPRVGERAS